VIEVAEVGQLVAERVDEARILEGIARLHVPEANRNPPVGGADTIATLHAAILGNNFAVSETEECREETGVSAQAHHEIGVQDVSRGGRPPPQTPHVPP